VTVASTEPTVQSELALAASARGVQLTIRAAVMRDVAKLWPALDPKRLDETWPGWLRSMILLVTNYHGQSAAAASRFYRASRSRATDSPAPSRLIRLAPSPAEDWLTRAFGYSGPGMFQKDTARPNTALSTTLGTAARIALDGGRTTVIGTVHADPVAVGWWRMTDGDPCPFCALQASRGIVFKSERAAEFKAHNDCGCSAQPAFSRDLALPSISTEADRIYVAFAKGAPSGKQLTAFRAAWAVRAQGDDAMRAAVDDALASH
jgi:class 3 adenylate cyclase